MKALKDTCHGLRQGLAEARRELDSHFCSTEGRSFSFFLVEDLNDSRSGLRQGLAEARREQNVDGPITCHASPLDTVTIVCSLPDGTFASPWVRVFINNSLSREKIVERDEHPEGTLAANCNPLPFSL